MNICKIKILAEKGVKLPSYQTSGSAGADICAFIPDGSKIVIKPMQRFMVPTGIKMAIPEGFEVQIRPRSGLAAKNGITCLNTPGTIDSDYRGDRIAQMVVAPVTQGVFENAEFLDETERGSGGFGHTGK